MNVVYSYATPPTATASAAETSATCGKAAVAEFIPWIVLKIIIVTGGVPTVGAMHHKSIIQGIPATAPNRAGFGRSVVSVGFLPDTLAGAPCTEFSSTALAIMHRSTSPTATRRRWRASRASLRSSKWIVTSGSVVLPAMAAKRHHGIPLLVIEHCVYLHERALEKTRHAQSSSVYSLAVRFLRQLCTLAYQGSAVMAGQYQQPTLTTERGTCGVTC